MSHGVRKVNEFIVRDGRALIMTQNVATGISQAQWDSIGNGTLYVAPTNGDLKYKKQGNDPKVWTKFLPDNVFDKLSMDGYILKDYTIEEIKMHTDSVSTRAIINRNVTSIKIGLEQILTEHFKLNTLSGTVIQNDTMDGDKLIDNTTNGGKITDRTLKGIKLELGTVSSLELGTNSVRRAHILNEEVIESKLSTDAVTRTKIKDGEVIRSKIEQNAIDNFRLNDKAVEWRNIHDDAIRRAHILDGEIIGSKLAIDSVTRAKIKDLEVVNSKLATDSITTVKVLNKSITLAKLEDSVQTIIRNAVIHKGDYATVKTNLKVKGNIVADPADLSYSISGFRVFNPLFADYAEGFVATEPVNEGDIVEIDKHGCVKKADTYSRKVVGIVSERYGFCLGANKEELENGSKVAIGLIGKVPVKVVGKVEAGDFIISSGDGIGLATKKFFPGAIVGKALEDKNSHGIGTVLCLIQPM